MGCDIHICTEVKINGQWHATAIDVNPGRNYTLFERMAGVRGKESSAMAAPRGVPEDAALMTAFASEVWGDDAHSHSWLSAREIADLEEWAKETKLPSHRPHGFEVWDFEWDSGCYLFGNSWAGFAKYPDKRPKGVEDVRWVFWFDN